MENATSLFESGRGPSLHVAPLATVDSLLKGVKEFKEYANLNNSLFCIFSFTSTSLITRFIFPSGVSEVRRDLPPEAAAEGDPVGAQPESRRHRGAEGPAERSPF